MSLSVMTRRTISLTMVFASVSVADAFFSKLRADKGKKPFPY